MRRSITFVYDEVNHQNDLSSCHYTPLKGIIRWQENLDDWKALARLYKRAAEKAALDRQV